MAPERAQSPTKRMATNMVKWVSIIIILIAYLWEISRAKFYLLRCFSLFSPLWIGGLQWNFEIDERRGNKNIFQMTNINSLYYFVDRKSWNIPCNSFRKIRFLSVFVAIFNTIYDLFCRCLKSLFRKSRCAIKIVLKVVSSVFHFVLLYFFP